MDRFAAKYQYGLGGVAAAPKSLIWSCSINCAVGKHPGQLLIVLCSIFHCGLSPVNYFFIVWDIILPLPGCKNITDRQG